MKEKKSEKGFKELFYMSLFEILTSTFRRTQKKTNNEKYEYVKSAKNRMG